MAPETSSDTQANVTFYAQWYKDADTVIKFVVDTGFNTTGGTDESRVGEDADHPTLCPRCAAVVAKLPQF